jgi:hypothetical protein
MKDERYEDEFEDEYEGDPRSPLSVLWVRAVLAAGALGVVSAIAMPYLIDWTRAPEPSANPRPAVVARMSRSSAAVPSPAPAPSAPVIAHVPSAPPPPSATPPATPRAAAMPAPVTPDTGGHLSVSASATATPADVASAPKPSSALPPLPGSVEKPTVTEGKTAMVASAVAKSSPIPSDESNAAPTKATVTAARNAGGYWVQVGAYKDPEIAQRVATRLREQGYHVEALAPTTREAKESLTPTPAPTAGESTTLSTATSDRYEVWVSGASVSALGERLRANGLAAASVASGVIVRPPLPLADAIALSKDLALDGLSVQVRREGSASAPASPSRVAASADGLHRVRVGAFPDHGAAAAVLRELSEKGYQGFIARTMP